MNSDRPELTAVTAYPQAAKHRTVYTIGCVWPMSSQTVTGLLVRS